MNGFKWSFSGYRFQVVILGWLFLHGRLEMVIFSGRFRFQMAILE